MFSSFRDPNGKFTLLAAAVAFMALAMFTLPFQGTALAIIPVVLLVGSLLCGVLWWRRRQADRYDLRRLFDEPPPSLDEPYEDQIPEGEEGAPYCGWCDECYPPGTRRCTRCRRELG